jgi:3-oxoacyl-[acyl-carrier-protein] synthase-3
MIRISSLSFAIAGSGSYLPRRLVPSEEIDALGGRPAGATQRDFAISNRHYAAPDETSSFMAAAAAQAALDEAGGGSIDALIAACGVMEQPIPGTALLIQRRLGLGASGIPAFDVNATCLSFLVALDQAVAGMALGRWRRVLVVSADIASAALDYGDPEASAIFGDGAAAFVLEAGGPHRLLASRLESYGAHADHCRLEAGGTRLRPHDDLDGFLARSRFRMDGPALFRATARRFPGFLDRLLGEAGVSREALDLVVPHQASAPAIAHLARELGGDRSRIVDIFARHGNQMAASLPHALHNARRAGRLVPGSTALLVGSAAGISLGGAVIGW